MSYNYEPKKGDALRQSEQRVLELVASGMGMKEIAAELNVSVRTIEMHMGVAKKKLGARTHYHFGYLMAKMGIEPAVKPGETA